MLSKRIVGGRRQGGEADLDDGELAEARQDVFDV